MLEATEGSVWMGYIRIGNHGDDPDQPTESDSTMQRVGSTKPPSRQHKAWSVGGVKQDALLPEHTAMQQLHITTGRTQTMSCITVHKLQNQLLSVQLSHQTARISKIGSSYGATYKRTTDRPYATLQLTTQ